MNVRAYVVDLLNNEANKTVEGLQTLLKTEDKLLLGLNECDYETGNTALHLAAEKDRDDIVRLLLQHGALTNIENKDEATAMGKAAKVNSWKAVQAFIDYGVLTDEKDSCQIGWIILLTVKAKKWTMVDCLLDKMTSECWLWNIKKDRLLHLLVINADDVGILKKTLECLGPMKLKYLIQTNATNESPLAIAVKMRKWPMFALMLQCLSKTDAQGLPLSGFLSVAIEEKQWVIAEALMSLGAKIKGYDPLKGFYKGKQIDDELARFLRLHSDNAPAEYNLQQAQLAYKAGVKANTKEKENHYFAQALTSLLEAIRRGSRLAFNFLETEFVAQQSFAPARLALARLYYTGQDGIAKINYKKVAQFAFEGDDLDKYVTKDYFQDKRVRGHLTTSQIIQIYVRHFYETGILDEKIETEIQKSITKQNIAVEMITNHQLFSYLEGGLSFIFEVFQDAKNSKTFSATQQAEFLRYCLENYSTDKSIKAQKEQLYDLVNSIMKIQDAPTSVSLTVLYFTVVLLNDDYLPIMLEKNEIDSIHFDVEKIFQPFLKHYPQKKIDQVKTLVQLYQGMARGEDIDAGFSRIASDPEAAFLLYKLIHHSGVINDKSKWKTLLQQKVWEHFKGVVESSGEPKDCLEQLCLLKKIPLFKANSQLFTFRAQNPILQEIDEMIKKYESMVLSVSFTYV